MKFIKIYLTIVTVLLLVGIGLGVYVWYTLQGINTTANGTNIQSEQLPIDNRAPTSSGGSTGESITIKMQDLPETQQKIAKELGLEGDSFTITPAMIQCAEAALGVDRVDEIVNGSTPSTLESLRLLPCLKR